MTKIEAIIQPYRLEDAKNALLEIGIAGLTVTEVKGFGRQGGQTEIYRGAEYTREFLPKSKLEVVVMDDAVEKVTAALLAVCRAERIGDGVLFNLPLHDAVRVRTGDTGEAAIEI